MGTSSIRLLERIKNSPLSRLLSKEEPTETPVKTEKTVLDELEELELEEEVNLNVTRT